MWIRGWWKAIGWLIVGLLGDHQLDLGWIKIPNLFHIWGEWSGMNIHKCHKSQLFCGLTGLTPHFFSPGNHPGGCRRLLQHFFHEFCSCNFTPGQIDGQFCYSPKVVCCWNIPRKSKEYVGWPWPWHNFCVLIVSWCLRIFFGPGLHW